MAKVRGIDCILGLTDDNFPVLCARSITFDIQRDSIETSVKGNGYFRSYVAGAASFTGSVEGFLVIDPTTDFTIPEVYNILYAGVPIELRYYEESTDGYWFQKTCYALVESINQTSSFDNIATFTVNFKGTGAPVLTNG